MKKAFVLLNSEAGFEQLVIKEVKNLSTVKDVFRVYGVFDIILRLEEDDLQRLEEVISYQIRRIKNVSATLTLHVTI